VHVDAIAVHVRQALRLEIEQLCQETRLCAHGRVINRRQHREIQIFSARTDYVPERVDDFRKRAGFFRRDLAELFRPGSELTWRDLCPAGSSKRSA
jgi:hypothetical protein